MLNVISRYAIWIRMQESFQGRLSSAKLLLVIFIVDLGNLWNCVASVATDSLMKIFFCPWLYIKNISNVLILLKQFGSVCRI